MFNAIVSLLILPFIPVWTYGNFFEMVQNFDSQKKAEICAESGDGCVKGSEAEGRDGSGGKEKSGDKFSGFSEYNLFPVDHALASGFVPVKVAGVYDLKLWAGSSVAIDVDSGTILHYDNGRKKTQIASLTKMMTAILALEKIKNLDEPVKITAGAINLTGTTVGCPTSVICNSNRMYPGEEVRAIDLLKATLMNSANDAAVSLAIHAAGTEKEFVKIMNEKAQELGLKDTQFCTASGLELDGKEDQCYSTAYDIARIAAYSLRHEKIWEITRIPEGRFYSTDGKYMHELKNTDLLLENLPNCIGGKTGFTPLAGKSLLLGAADDTGRHRIIAVLLNDEERWADMRLLVNWIFESYSWR